MKVVLTTLISSVILGGSTGFPVARSSEPTSRPTTDRADPLLIPPEGLKLRLSERSDHIFYERAPTSQRKARPVATIFMDDVTGRHSTMLVRIGNSDDSNGWVPIYQNDSYVFACEGARYRITVTELHDGRAHDWVSILISRASEEASVGLSEAATTPELKRIIAALDRLRDADVRLTRNGKPFAPATAATFLTGRFSSFKPPIATFAEFIDLIVTGKSDVDDAYAVLREDGSSQPLAEWFTE